VLIARLMREVQDFVANSLIQEGASADEIWTQFLKNLNNSKRPQLVSGSHPSPSSSRRIAYPQLH
jgi:hypothetical protein